MRCTVKVLRISVSNSMVLGVYFRNCYIEQEISPYLFVSHFDS